MDRLTRTQIEKWRRIWTDNGVISNELSALCDLALQSLSQEAVREETTKVDQTEFGAQGNCQSACLAMLLGVPLAKVPNFAQIALAQDNNAADKAQQDWLHEHGWGLVTIVKWQSLPWPPKHGFYIAGGTSKRGNRHGVVFKDGELWHDPHPDRTGIESVDDVDILYPLAPFRALKREPNAAGEVERARCTLCSSEPSPGFYTGCMIQDGETKQTGWNCDGKGNLTRLPAPAAPDVASMVKRLNDISEGREGRIAHIFKDCREAATLLARLGQGWVPTLESESKGAFLTGIPGKPIYAVDERAEPYCWWRFDLPALPPAPGASDD